MSFVHGDFVPANIHIDINKNKIGLIDFANSNYYSTIHNDIYNFKLAIETMYINRNLKNKIIKALYCGIGDLPDDSMQEFFRIYHIHRWLMLKTQSNNPLELCRIFYNKNNIQQI